MAFSGVPLSDGEPSSEKPRLLASVGGLGRMGLSEAGLGVSQLSGSVWPVWPFL